MPEKVLVTGGAGFIGRCLASKLLAAGHEVRVLDSFVEQAHGGERPDEALFREVELIRGDVRDDAAVARAVAGIDSVVHLAAEVGVGQSMYAITRYVGANDLGTAVLLQALIDRPVRRVVVASSMSIYGEGLYRDVDGTLVETAERRADLLARQQWDPVDARGRALTPVPTPEWKRPMLTSVYAVTKHVQERLVLAVAGAYGMEGVALRLWNTYGPGQALGNPYTGVLANFATRLLNRRPPMIFEDGRQQRDFVHIDDVTDAFVLALGHPRAAGAVYNIASGEPATVATAARLLGAAMGRPELVPEITGGMRAGDVRHSVPDISLASREIGFRPRHRLAEGLAELATWVEAQGTSEDRVATARAELEQRGLVS